MIYSEKIKKEFAIAGKNGVVLSKERALSSFSYLASEYDENNVFTASNDLSVIFSLLFYVYCS